MQHSIFYMYICLTSLSDTDSQYRLCQVEQDFSDNVKWSNILCYMEILIAIITRKLSYQLN